MVVNRQVEVKAGMTMHNNYTFKGEGHQQPGQNPSNLYVNFQLVAPDARSPDYPVTSRYGRKGDDLFYRHPITLQDSIQCKPVKIPLLDGRVTLLAIDQVITPKTILTVDGEGVKVYDRNDPMDENVRRGDLYVSFDIQFPRKVSTANKEKLIAILS